MAVVVIMPKQGQSVESCIITELKKKKGDTVQKGDILFSYETDKASFEEEAPAGGVVLECFYSEGDEVPVLENMMVIGEPGEDISSLLVGRESPAEGNKGVSMESRPADSLTSEKQEQKESSTPFTVQSGRSPVSPRARKLAEKNAVDTSGLSGSGPKGRIIEKDIQAVLHDRPKMTPLAKKLAAEQGMLPQSSGTGLAGTARASDLSVPVNSVYGKDYEERKISNMRKIIARSMHASLQNSAQLTHHLGADARRILVLRKKAKAMLEEGSLDINITLNDMVCFSVIRALKKFPNVNTHFLGDSIRYFSKIHLGLAVDTERGLMVPVIRNADDLSITGLARQFKEIAAACRNGSVNPDILSPEAGSFTVSNLGNYGVEMFTPVINLPQSAILGVNTIVPRPKDIGDDVYAFVPFIGLSLTYDHRSLDGGEATRFLKQIAIEIENLEFEI
ncbi:branched-chain alpha-keto acid dehydrogenase subunit E2 [Proteiniphilum saccharofermentans]|uniref:Dihydrolipoamide acetyltransferase component of pyruvate dehydrogenase complex n=1 Tax=Proteiniphilum saccharofermentans TaxID=1642647 RepID=A0A1R3T1I5_9BACT|nr:dihydrolipoamide acetyltransferase family protein [Proteiniphilum saccharofermentans]SCD20990.1 branched-chain alpha-keto acid dehydrogenase subunit E2 [Proteiniphilum saccharofermentans]SFL45023.1 pyruvate dehydrogenase E2 component (dihydrolipoamide acetyltransferase) [Porphyromonadaceae bacterium KH3CP3RA]